MQMLIILNMTYLNLLNSLLKVRNFLVIGDRENVGYILNRLLCLIVEIFMNNIDDLLLGRRYIHLYCIQILVYLVMEEYVRHI
jgi:hypothetical protein